MNNKLSLQIFRELLWWLLTVILAFLVLLPIYGTISNTYLQPNLLIIIAAFTYFRYIIFLNETPYLATLPVRVLLIIIVALGFWQFVTKLQQFMNIVDNYTISLFLNPEKILTLDNDAQQDAYAYFKREYLLFNLSVLILSVVLVVRTIASLWKLGKKG